MIGWRHGLKGHEFEQTLGDSGDQGARCAAVHGQERPDNIVVYLCRTAPVEREKKMEAHSSQEQNS